MKTNNTETNTKAVKINFQAYGIFDKKTGELDEKATFAKFQKDALAWKELQKNDQVLITKYLEEQFSIVPVNTAMLKDAVVTLVMAKIGFTNETYKDLSERVVAAIDNNPRYYTQLGLGGGLKRMTDAEFDHYNSTGANPAEVAAAAKKAAAEKKAAEKAAKAKG